MEEEFIRNQELRKPREQQDEVYIKYEFIFHLSIIYPKFM